MTIFNARGHYSVENEVRFCGERYMLCMDQDLNVTASGVLPFYQKWLTTTSARASWQANRIWSLSEPPATAVSV